MPGGHAPFVGYRRGQRWVARAWAQGLKKSQLTGTCVKGAMCVEGAVRCPAAADAADRGNRRHGWEAHPPGRCLVALYASSSPLCVLCARRHPAPAAFSLFVHSSRHPSPFLVCPPPPPCAEALWRSVGRALKRVDRGLLGEWLRWTNAVFPSAQALAEWDSFPPVCCDTHALASDVRDVFMKLLRQRKVDLPAAFRAAVGVMWRVCVRVGGGGRAA